MAASKPQLQLVANTIYSGPDSSDPEAGPVEHADYVERLYCQYRASLLNYIAGMLPEGRQEADVIMQETYVRLLRQDSLSHLQENARAYIFTIATNLVRDSLRRHLRRHGDAHESLDEDEHACTGHSPSHNAQWQQSLERLKAALLDLNSTTRQVFLLSRFEEKTYPEIAAILSISTRTVERHMSTAFKHLQQTLEDFL